jgi:plastocyanin
MHRNFSSLIALATLFGLASSAASAANLIVNVFTDTTSNTSPAVTNAQVGDTVTFNNVGASPGFHNVVSNAGATQFRCANGCDGAGGNGDPSSANWSATITLTTASTINYFCEVHGGTGVGMFGTINVNVPVGLQSFGID